MCARLPGAGHLMWRLSFPPNLSPGLSCMPPGRPSVCQTTHVDRTAWPGQPAEKICEHIYTQAMFIHTTLLFAHDALPGWCAKLLCHSSTQCQQRVLPCTAPGSKPPTQSQVRVGVHGGASRREGDVTPEVGISAWPREGKRAGDDASDGTDGSGPGGRAARWRTDDDKAAMWRHCLLRITESLPR